MAESKEKFVYLVMSELYEKDENSAVTEVRAAFLDEKQLESVRVQRLAPNTLNY